MRLAKLFGLFMVGLAMALQAAPAQAQISEDEMQAIFLMTEFDMGWTQANADHDWWDTYYDGEPDGTGGVRKDINDAEAYYESVSQLYGETNQYIEDMIIACREELLESRLDENRAVSPHLDRVNIYDYPQAVAAFEDENWLLCIAECNQGLDELYGNTVVQCFYYFHDQAMAHLNGASMLALMVWTEVSIWEYELANPLPPPPMPPMP